MTIREYMEKKGLSFRQMEKLTGVDHSTLYRYSIPSQHKSSRSITLETAQKLVKATKGDITLEDLLDR